MDSVVRALNRHAIAVLLERDDILSHVNVLFGNLIQYYLYSSGLETIISSAPALNSDRKEGD